MPRDLNANRLQFPVVPPWVPDVRLQHAAKRFPAVFQLTKVPFLIRHHQMASEIDSMGALKLFERVAELLAVTTGMPARMGILAELALPHPLSADAGRPATYFGLADSPLASPLNPIDLPRGALRPLIERCATRASAGYTNPMGQARRSVLKHEVLGANPSTESYQEGAFAAMAYKTLEANIDDMLPLEEFSLEGLEFKAMTRNQHRYLFMALVLDQAAGSVAAALGRLTDDERASLGDQLLAVCDKYPSPASRATIGQVYSKKDADLDGIKDGWRAADVMYQEVASWKGEITTHNLTNLRKYLLLSSNIDLGPALTAEFPELGLDFDTRAAQLDTSQLLD